MLANSTKKGLSSKKYNFSNYLQKPIKCTDEAKKTEHLTTVMTIKVKYIYFLYYYGVSFSNNDRKIVTNYKHTTAIKNIIF